MAELVEQLRDDRYSGQQGMRAQAADEIERLKASNALLIAKLEKVCAWLGRLAANAETAAKDTRFASLAEANAKDAKNYRLTITDLRQAIDLARQPEAAPPSCHDGSQ
jgi:hypothetical protein